MPGPRDGATATGGTTAQSGAMSRADVATPGNHATEVLGPPRYDGAMDASAPVTRDSALWRAVTLMGRRLQGELEHRLQEAVGVSVPDFEILGALAASPEGRLRAGELGEMLGWEKSRTSHHVARMEARELVRRVTCSEDQRGTWVEIAAQGRARVAAGQPVFDAAVRHSLVDVLTPAEASLLGAAAIRVLDASPETSCRIEVDRLAGTLDVRQATAH